MMELAATAPATGGPRQRHAKALGHVISPGYPAEQHRGAHGHEYADQELADLREQSGPVGAAVIDEFRRRASRPASDGREARSEWFTHLVDLESGETLGLAQERTGEAGKSLVKEHAGTLRYLAMDLSAPTAAPSPAA